LWIGVPPTQRSNKVAEFYDGPSADIGKTFIDVASLGENRRHKFTARCMFLTQMYGPAVRSKKISTI
jgi:hypothetical protein